MNQAERIRLGPINQSRPQCCSGILAKIDRRAKNYFFARRRMLKRDFRRMQANPMKRYASVQCIAENGKPVFRRMNSNLVRPAGERLSFPNIVGADVRRL